MLVELTGLGGAYDGAVSAHIMTELGSLTAVWRGEPDAPPGRYRVEWTIDQDLAWGRNSRPATSSEPLIAEDGDTVLLRGLLQLTDDGAAFLELGGSSILLDLDGPVPSHVHGSWIELRLRREDILLYPYHL